VFPPCLEGGVQPARGFSLALEPRLIDCVAFSIVMSRPTVSNKCGWFGMTTKSWMQNFPAVIYERSTSTRSVALRSDYNNGGPWLVFVGAKKYQPISRSHRDENCEPVWTFTGA
jgi:hypothetical protein